MHPPRRFVVHSGFPSGFSYSLPDRGEISPVQFYLPDQTALGVGRIYSNTQYNVHKVVFPTLLDDLLDEIKHIHCNTTFDERIVFLSVLQALVTIYRDFLVRLSPEKRHRLVNLLSTDEDRVASRHNAPI
jgi:hypothetical protein